MKKMFYLMLLVMILAVSPVFSSGNTETEESGTKSEKVVVWSWKATDSWDTTIAAFQEKYPEVEVEHVPHTWSEYELLLKTSYVAGEYPDVLGLKPGAMMKTYQSTLEDLEPWAGEEWGSSWQNRYVQAGLDSCYLSSGGNGLFGLPHSLETTISWYSVPVFKELGLSVPQSYDEMVAASAALRKSGYAPFLVGAKDGWPNKDVFMILCNEFAPEKFYKAEAGEIPWTDSDLVTAMEWWKKLFDDGIIVDGAFGMTHYMDAVDIIGGGMGGMLQNGSWHMGFAYPQTRPENYIVDQRPFAFPDMDGDGVAPQNTGGADMVLSMINKSEVKDGAWKFIKWMTSEEGATVNALETSIRPVKGAGAPGDFNDWETEDWNFLHEQYANSTLRNMLYSELDSGINDILAAVGTGALSPADGMAELEKISTKIKR